MMSTVTNQQVEARVIEALASFGPDVSQITREATFEELDIDSLDLVELAQIVEDEYGVVLKGEDMKELKTVGDAIDLIASRAAEAPSCHNGLGAVTPLGVGAAALHERWAAGVCGIADGEGACREYDPTEHLSIKEARRLDRFSQFAVVASGEALAQAGWGEELPVRPHADRLRDRHRDRRNRHGRDPARCDARSRHQDGLAAGHPAVHAKRRLGRGVDEARSAGPDVRRRVRLLGWCPCDRVGRPHDPVRRRRRGCRRRCRGHADRIRLCLFQLDAGPVPDRCLTALRCPSRRLRHG